MLNSLFHKNVSLLFRISLIISGTGSCALAIAFPYYLLSIHEPIDVVFKIQAVIFLGAAIGSFFWGTIIDNSKNFWRDRILTLLCEFLVCIVVGIIVFFKAGLVWTTLSLGILEFLFMHEIAWSRVAYKIIPENQDRSPEEISREITVAASVISIVAPMVGTYFAMQDQITLLIVINIFSFIPYAILCLTLALYQKETNINNLEINNDDKELELLSFKDFLEVIKTNKFWLFYFFSSVFFYVADSIIMTALPELVFSSTIEKNNEFILPIFYLGTGLLATFFNSENAVKIIPSSIVNSCFKLSCGFLIAGIIFLSFDNIIIRGFGYCLINILMIRISVNLMSAVYQESVKRIKGRLILLSQFISRVSVPIVSSILGFVPESYLLSSLISSFVINMLLGIFIFYKMETASDGVSDGVKELLES